MVGSLVRSHAIMNTIGSESYEGQYSVVYVVFHSPIKEYIRVSVNSNHHTAVLKRS